MFSLTICELILLIILYINKGLPQDQLQCLMFSAIDAVLNAEKHDYIYFCANPDKPGYHAFASSYEAHQVNAKNMQIG